MIKTTIQKNEKCVFEETRKLSQLFVQMQTNLLVHDFIQLVKYVFLMRRGRRQLGGIDTLCSVSLRGLTSLKCSASFWEFVLGFTGFEFVCHFVVCLFIQSRLSEHIYSFHHSSFHTLITHTREAQDSPTICIKATGNHSEVLEGYEILAHVKLL